VVDSCAMSDAPPVRSPTRPVSGYEFASRVLSRFPEDGVQMLLDFAGNESDWLEKKAGVYPWAKDDEVVKLREQGEAIYARDYPCLEHKLCRTIVEAIVALHNLRGGVVFIGIDDSKENRVVPLRENDPEGFLEKDVDNYIRNAVDPRLWPKDALFCEKDGNRRLVAPVPDKDAVFRTECVQFKGEPILAVLVHERAPGAMPLSFSVEPKAGAARTEVVYRSPGSKGCVARLAVTNDNRLRDFLEIIRPKSLSNFDLADQAARWGISFPVAEPPPLPRPTKTPRLSFPPAAAAMAALAAAVPFLLAAVVVVLFLAFSDDEEDEEDEVADFRPVPTTVASSPASVPAAPVAKPEPAPRERAGTTAGRPVSPPVTIPTTSGGSGGFDRTVTIDDVYRSAKRAGDKDRPTASGAAEWDDETRFVARRKLKESLLRWKEDLSKMDTTPDEPVPDAAGTATLPAGRTFFVRDIGSSGISKLVLDGGTLLAQSLSVRQVLDARARCDDLLADVEANRVSDDVLRKPDLFVAEQIHSFSDPKDPDWGMPVLAVPVEVGPKGGSIEATSSGVRFRGPFVPGPDGAGTVEIRGIAEFFSPGLSPDVPLRGYYSVVEDDPGSFQRIRYLYQHLSFWNANGSKPDQTRAKAYKSAFTARPDANGDIVVGAGRTLILPEVPTDGSVKRIVLRGGALAFLPPRGKPDSLIDVFSFEVPIVVGKEGGEIGACRQDPARSPWGVREARLRSPVENEFGERPTVIVSGDVLLDAERFSSKVRVETFHTRGSEAARSVRVFSGSRSPNGPMDWDEPGRGDYRFCDFSGPFPVSSNRKH